MQLVVSAGGTIRCLYDESIELAAFGHLSISRGSFVEPTTDGQWLINLGPAQGRLHFRMGTIIVTCLETCCLDSSAIRAMQWSRQLPNRPWMI